MKESDTDSINMLQAILQSIDEGIHAVDHSGKTIYYNEAAGRLDGLRPEDVIGKHVLDIFPSLKRETSTLVQVLETGKPLRNKPQSYTNYLGIKVHTVNTTLPIFSHNKVIGAVEVAKDFTELKRLSEQIVDLQAKVAKTTIPSVKRGQNHSSAIYTFEDILTCCPHMDRLKASAMRAAQTSSPVLIYGETGTGKELFVHAIHNSSKRRNAPFLAQNCAALPASLLESILFGTVRGSFTGAVDRPGLFELAHGGTLFLDEINSMPIELQAKLLRVLQDGNIMRVGASDIRKTDVRLITATNVNPLRLVETQKLRADLFYRLNVVTLSLPRLIERQGDIPLLIEHFLHFFGQKFDRQQAKLHPAAKECLLRYNWPGNVRELAHVIEGALNIADEGLITIEGIPSYIREQDSPFATNQQNLQQNLQQNTQHNLYALPSIEAARSNTADVMDLSSLNLRAGLEQLEQQIISRALLETQGNILQAAKLLGIPRQTLQYKLGKLQTREKR